LFFVIRFHAFILSLDAFDSLIYKGKPRKVKISRDEIWWFIESSTAFILHS
jgi:hypothetical protein